MDSTCPCCEKHCPQNYLSCHRGLEYFKIKEDGHRHHSDIPVNSEEKIIILLRKCGHFLHHNVGRDENVEPLLNALTSEERKTLEMLLEKCLYNWQNLMNTDN